MRAWSTVTGGQRGRVDSRWSWRAAVRDPELIHRRHHPGLQPPRRPRQLDRQQPHPARPPPDHRRWWPARVRPMSPPPRIASTRAGRSRRGRRIWAPTAINRVGSRWAERPTCADSRRMTTVDRASTSTSTPCTRRSRPWRAWPTWRRSRWHPARVARTPPRATARIWGVIGLRIGRRLRRRMGVDR